jgi:uncharacterized membrane protein
MSHLSRVVVVVVVVVVVGPACSPTETLDDAVCPPAGTTLSYSNFGEPFLAVHCQTCHASNELDRRGAPTGFSFDTRAEVLEHADRIYARAAASNTSMPPGPDDPSEAERLMLAEWLACGAL